MRFQQLLGRMPSSLLILLLFYVVRSRAAAGAPAAAAAPLNLTVLMAKKGCGAFAALVSATGDAAETFASNVDGGLTVFCPRDDAMKPFLPRFKNLSADGKLSLLLYHAIPVYYSLQLLQTGNGVVNTLATDGAARDYNLTVQNDGERVTLRTGVAVAAITETLVDQDPLAMFAIDRVLEPVELFKPPPEPPAPAPAPETERKAAAAPKAGKRASASPPAPAGPEGQPADQQAADKSAAVMNGAHWWAAAWTAAAIVAAAAAA